MNIKRYIHVPMLVLVAAFAVAGCEKGGNGEEGTSSDSSQEATRNDAQVGTDKDAQQVRESAEKAADTMSDAAQDAAEKAKEAADAVKQEVQDSTAQPQPNNSSTGDDAYEYSED